jgi:hypothetical protein
VVPALLASVCTGVPLIVLLAVDRVGNNVVFCAAGVATATCARRALPGRRRHHGVDGDALHASVDVELSDEQLAADPPPYPDLPQAAVASPAQPAPVSTDSGRIPIRCARSTALTRSETPSLA